MNKETNIPIGWKEVKLGEICHINSNSLTDKTDENFSFYYIDLSMVNDGAIEYPSNQILFKNSPSRARRIFKKGDILMSTVRPNLLGHAIIKSEVKNCICSTGFAVVEEKNGLSCNEYIYPNLFSYNIKKQIDSILVGSNYPAINSNDVKNLKILLPPLQEQKVIADILEKWDEAIEKTTKLIEAKKKRFEWVRKFSLTTKKDWENIKLKDFLIESNQKSQIENEYKILSSTMNSVEIRSGRVDAVSNIGYKIIRRNQLVLSPQNLWLGNINVNTDYEVGLVSPSYKIFDFNENIILSDFAKFLFKTNKMLWNYKLCSEAGASVVRRNLDLNLFYEIKIFIPALEQQKQIAKTLNTAKKEITILEEILANYKSQKKGLMQKLLTGKIRVNNINLEIRK